MQPGNLSHSIEEELRRRYNLKNDSHTSCYERKDDDDLNNVAPQVGERSQQHQHESDERQQVDQVEHRL